MKILPIENYRRLEVGEVIEPGDVAFAKEANLDLFQDSAIVTSFQGWKLEADNPNHYYRLKPAKEVSAVNHPAHYAHPSGVECIEIAEHMNFNLGNVLKYVMRADLKGNAIEDLEKAAWYVAREISRRKGGAK